MLKLAKFKQLWTNNALTQKLKGCAMFSTNFLKSLPCYDFSPLSANPTKWSNTLKKVAISNPGNFLRLFIRIW